MTGEPLDELERQRAELYARLAGTGDFRPGSVSETWRRCGALAQWQSSGLLTHWFRVRPPGAPRGGLHVSVRSIFTFGSDILVCSWRGCG